jgi:EmrB/QacA subfamily drug resistance transporter
MTDSSPDSSSVVSSARRRWLILITIGLAQLMVVLDVTIVNIALPSAQHALGFSTDDRQWIVTVYSLAFGGLLLVGGRLSDIFGIKTTFIIGLIGFAVASAAGGAAQGFGTLVAARIVQGVFAALLAPSALALLTITFTDPVERRKALGIYTAIAGAGGVVGLLLGGVLAEYASWRWCLYVNAAFAIAALVGAVTLLKAQQRDRTTKLDVPGSLLVVAGLIGIVYGLGNASSDGWGAPVTLVPIIVGCALLVGFVLVERRTARPLLPLAIVANRTRGASYLGGVIAAMAAVGMFLLVTYYLQGSLGFSPLQAGLAFLPFMGGTVIGANVVSNIGLPRFGPKVVVPIGMLVTAVGTLWLSRIDVGSGYGLGVAPALVLMGFGASAPLIASFALGSAGTAATDAGIASALVNSSNQIGGSLGAALLNTLTASAASSYLTAHPATPQAITAASLHGNDVAFGAMTAILIAGAVATGLLHRRKTSQMESEPVPLDVAVL